MLSLAAAAAIAPVTGAAPNTWNGLTDLSWDNDANWSTGLKPIDSDDVIFPTSIPATGADISLGFDNVANSVTLNDSYNLVGGKLTLTTGNLSVATGKSVTITSELASVAGGINYAGGGTVSLGANSFYTGVTSIAGGTRVNITDQNQLGDASATNGVTLSGGGALGVTGSIDLGTSRTVTVGTGGGTIDTGTATDTTTLSGALAGAGTLTKNGSGVLLLQGDGTAFTGGVVVNSVAGGLQQSTLRLNTSTSLTGVAVTLNNTTHLNTATNGGVGTNLDLDGGITATNLAVTMNSGTSGANSLRTSITSGNGDNTLTGTITLAGTGPTQLYSNTAANTFTVNSAISGSSANLGLRGAGAGVLNGTVSIGTTGLSKTDSGTWTINSTGNTWGGTQISVGTLRMGAANVLPSATVVTMSQTDGSAVTLDLNGFDQTIAGLTNQAGTGGTKQVTSTAAATLTINNAADHSYAYNVAGALSLVKTGAGVQNLNGTNSLTGTIAVNAGVLGMGSDTAAAAPGGLTVADGATFRATNSFTSNRNVTLGGAGALLDAVADRQLTHLGTITSTTGLTKTGAGTLALLGTSAYTGTSVVRQGTLAVGGDVAPSVDGALGNGATAVQVGDAVAGQDAAFLVGAARSTVAPATTTFGRGIAVAGGAGARAIGTADNVGPQLAITSTITGPVTFGKATDLYAGQFSVAKFETALNFGGNAINKTGAGVLEVTGGTALSNYSGINVNAGALRINAGAGNTIATAGPVANQGVIHAASGTADFGGAVLTSASPFTAGLRENRTSSTSIDTTTLNTGGAVRTSTVALNVPGNTNTGSTTSNVYAGGWITNTTYTYTGQFFVADGDDSGSDPFQFGESFDDRMRVYVDGAQVLSNDTYNVSGYSPLLNLSKGWHTLEIRGGQGGGGVGATAFTGWNGTIGVGVNMTGVDNTTNQTGYVAISTANLGLRTLSSMYQVDAGATLKAGGIANGGQLIMNGGTAAAPTTLELTLASPTVSDVQTISTAGTNPYAVINLSGGQTFNTANVSLANGTTLVTRGGTVNVGVSSDPTSVFTSTVGTNAAFQVDSGTLNLTRPGTYTATTGVSVGAGTANFNDTGDATVARIFSSDFGAAGAAGAVNVAGGRTLTIGGHLPTTSATGLNTDFRGSSLIGSFTTGAATNVVKGAGQLLLDGKVTLTGNLTTPAGTDTAKNYLRLGNTATGAGANTIGGAITINGGVLDLRGTVNAVGGSASGGAPISIAATTATGTATTTVLRYSPNLAGAVIADETPGFLARWWNVGTGLTTATNLNNVAPIAVRTESTIDYANQASGGLLNRPAGVNASNNSATWQGMLNVTTAGDYTFFGNSDDGSVVYVDGVPLILNDGSHGVRNPDYSGAISLTPGKHLVTVRYSQGSGGAAMFFNYQGPDTGNTKVPVGSIANSVTNGTVTVNTTNNVTFQGDSTIDIAADTVEAGALNIANNATLTVSSQSGLGRFTHTGTGALNGTLTLTTPAGYAANVVLAGNYSGTGGFVRASANGTVALTGTNTFAGGTTLNANTGALVARAQSLPGATTTNAGTSIVFEQDVDGTLNGTISGAGSVTKNGAGALFFNGNQTYTGATTVTAGTIGGNGAVASAITVGPGAGIFANAGNTFSPTGLTLATGSFGNFGVAAPSATPLVNVTGSFSLGAQFGINLSNLGGLGLGTYRLIDYTGSAISGSQFAGISLTSKPAGFFYTLQNNTGNTSIDLLVTAGAATNTWTGATSGDLTTATNWSAGSYTEGQQLLFTDAGANKAITGAAVAPQTITVNNSVGNDYSIANDISGSLAGGVNKQGTGTLRLTGNNTFTGGAQVDAGTLRGNVSSTQTSLGTGTLTLNGGTLQLDYVPTATTAGLTADYRATATNLGNTSQVNVLAAPAPGGTRVEGLPNVTWTSGAANSPPVTTPPTFTVAGGNAERFAVQMNGRIFIPAELAGTDLPFSLNSDDGSRLFIDGRLVINNEGPQGGAYGATGNVQLAAGWHEVRVEAVTGTGGAFVRLGTPWGQSAANLFTSDAVTLANGLSVTANSTLAVPGGEVTRVNMGALTVAGGSTLTVTGEAGKTVSFDGLLKSGGTSAIAISNTPDVRIGGPASVVGGTIVKTGAGRLTFDNVAGSGFGNNLTGTTLDIQGGQLVGFATSNAGSTNPLAGSTIRLNGGNLLLDGQGNSNNGNTPVAFDANVQIAQNARIEAQPSGLTLTLGGAGRSLSVAAGTTLTVDSYAGSVGIAGAPTSSIGNAAGATLAITAPLSGSGSLVKTSTALGTPNSIITHRNWGQLNLAADNAAFSGAITVDKGILQAQATSATAKPLGTGTVTMIAQPYAVGGVATLAGTNGLSWSNATANALFLKGNGAGSNQTVNFGNALSVTGSGPEVRFDVNNNGGNSGNTILLGALDITGAPNLNTITVSGANNYALSFASTAGLTIDKTFTFNTTTGNLTLPMNVTATGQTINKTGTATLTLNGTNTFGAINATGGTLAATSNAALNNFASPISLTATTLSLAGGATASDGAGANTAAFLANVSFKAGSGVRFDNAQTNLADRWGDGEGLTVTTGAVQLLGNSTAAASETVGSLTFRGGTGVRVARAGTQTATLSLTSLLRQDRGTIQLTTAAANQLGVSDFVRLLDPASVNTGVNVNGGSDTVAPAWIVNETDHSFVQYDASGGDVGLKNAPFKAATALDAASAGDLINQTASIALGGTTNVYGLRITGNVAITGGQLNIHGGGLILNNSSNPTTSTPIVFGADAATPVEGVVFHNNSSAAFATLSGKLTADGLTKFGNSVTVLSADNSWDGNVGTAGLRGTVTINGGGLSYRKTNATGTTSSLSLGDAVNTSVVLAGGTLEGRLDGNANIGAQPGDPLGGGTLMDVNVIANSTINIDRSSSGGGSNMTHHFGDLTIAANTALTTSGGNGYRPQFNGTTALGGGTVTINTSSMDLFVKNLTELAPTSLVKTGPNRLEVVANNLGSAVALSNPVRIENGVIQYDWNATTTADPLAAANLAFGGSAASPHPITFAGLIGSGTAGVTTASPTFRLRADGSASGTNNAAVDFRNDLVVARDTVASFFVYQNNNNLANAPHVTVSGDVSLGGTLFIGDDAAATARGLATIYSGQVTIDQATPGMRGLLYTTNVGGRAGDLTSGIADGAGAAANPLTLQARNGILNVKGAAGGMTYAGGTTVLQSDVPGQNAFVNVDAASRLGTGDVTNMGASLLLQSASNLSAGKKVSQKVFGNSQPMLTIGYDPVTAAGVQGLLAADSVGVLAVDGTTSTTASNWDIALNQAALGSGRMFLGAHRANRTYTPATLGVGADNTYRLGGGYAQLILANASNNVLTGASAKLQVGMPLVNGGGNSTGAQVIVNGSNDFGGGTTVDFGQGTLTANAAGGLGTGPIVVNSGNLNLNGAHLAPSLTVRTGTANLGVAQALPSTSSIAVGTGQNFSVTAALQFAGEHTYTGAFDVLGPTTLRPNGAVVYVNGPSTAAAGTPLAGGNFLTVQTSTASGATPGVIFLNGAAPTTTSASTNALLTSSALAVNDAASLPGGNLNIAGGTLILANTSWAQFNANRTGGVAATGAGTWQLTGNGGFAARTTGYTITAGNGVTANTFNRDFTLGSSVLTNGVAFADAGVTIGTNTELTARRLIQVGNSGPGLTRATGTAGTSVQTIAGNLADGTSKGAVLVRSLTTGANDGQIAELVLSGANTWTGSATADADGGGNVNWFSTGPGGLMISTINNPGTNADVFVRFDDTAKAAGQTSLPTGNGGQTAYLFADRYGNAFARGGFLLTGKTGGQAYQLPTGYKFLVGGLNNTPGPAGATGIPGGYQGSVVGAAGGDATLKGSAIAVLSGNSAGSTSVAGAMTLLAREGVFTLGGAGADAVSFQTSSMVGTNNAQGTTDPGINAAATTLSNSTGGRTVFVRGGGTVSLGGVTFDSNDGSGDSSAQFTFHLGAQPAGTNIADGFVRENSDAAYAADAVTDNLSGAKVTTSGGTIEFAGTPRAITLGTGVGQVNLGGVGGGGFAAKGGPRTANLNGGAALTWGAGNFVANNAPLIVGSPTADNTLTLPNDVALGAANRTVLTVTGAQPAGTATADLSGVISGTGGLVVDAAKRADGTTTAGGTVVLSNAANTYTGPTSVAGGTLRVNGSVAASSGVAVATGGRFVAGSTQTVKALDLSAGSGQAEIANVPASLLVLTVGDGSTTAVALQLGAASKLDLRRNAM
ncbi:MAG TPA: autotransporter-associated beta strand repeat-containing protein, partial [Tepidisphaeraceae bacterium]|nr:autotransporter-associated beta strand repeat-containing protein [Tepidisphaeraceae bacterium]